MPFNGPYGANPGGIFPCAPYNNGGFYHWGMPPASFQGWMTSPEGFSRSHGVPPSQNEAPQSQNEAAHGFPPSSSCDEIRNVTSHSTVSAGDSSSTQAVPGLQDIVSTLKTVTDTMNRLISVPNTLGTASDGNIVNSQSSSREDSDSLPADHPINSSMDSALLKEGEGGDDDGDEGNDMIKEAPPSDRWENAFKKEKVGSDVSEELQVFVSKACTMEPDPDFIKTIREKHIMPGNCPVVTSPAIHKRVWRALGHKGREADLERKKVHQNSLHSLYASLEVSDRITKLQAKYPEDPDIVELEQASKESVYLQGYACYTHSLHRREHLRSAFKADYRSLCNRDQPLSENMFSKEFSKDCKELSETNKAVDAALSAPDSSKTPKGKGKSKANSKAEGGGKWKNSSNSVSRGRADNHPYHRNYNHYNHSYDSHPDSGYNYSSGKGRGGQSFRGKDRSSRGGSTNNSNSKN